MPQEKCRFTDATKAIDWELPDLSYDMNFIQSQITTY
jgi:hypothetical protein